LRKILARKFSEQILIPVGKVPEQIHYLSLSEKFSEQILNMSSSSSSSSSSSPSSFAAAASLAGQKRRSREEGSGSDSEEESLRQDRKKFAKLVSDIKQSSLPTNADYMWKQEQLFRVVKELKKGAH